jgi:SAM-dependent methyltransferase
MNPDEQLQRSYYAATAAEYNARHLGQKDEPEHDFAVDILTGIIRSHEWSSVLDVGAGTGRLLLELRDQLPQVRRMGVEPVDALREQGWKAGLSQGELVDGDAMRLAFPDQSFDLVCEFGVLHHLRNPEVAVAEMLRVAKKAVFLSDSNNFGAGSRPARLFKRMLRALGLWRLADWIRTKGKGYHFSKGDGVFYSYSLFDSYPQIAKLCESVHVMNTRGGGIRPLNDASHALLLGIKKKTLE